MPPTPLGHAFGPQAWYWHEAGCTTGFGVNGGGAGGGGGCDCGGGGGVSGVGGVGGAFDYSSWRRVLTNGRLCGTWAVSSLQLFSPSSIVYSI